MAQVTSGRSPIIRILRGQPGVTRQRAKLGGARQARGESGEIVGQRRAVPVEPLGLDGDHVVHQSPALETDRLLAGLVGRETAAEVATHACLVGYARDLDLEVRRPHQDSRRAFGALERSRVEAVQLACVLNANPAGAHVAGGAIDDDDLVASAGIPVTNEVSDRDKRLRVGLDYLAGGVPRGVVRSDRGALEPWTLVLAQPDTRRD